MPVRLPNTLFITNDFPPRIGGAQQYVYGLVRNLPPERVFVLAPAWRGVSDFDKAQPFWIEREARVALRPTPTLARRLHQLVRATGAEVVVFGHALPLGLLGPGLAARGTPYVVCTHGREHWMAQVPGLAASLRRATSRAERVFAISRFTGRVIRTAVPSSVPLSLFPPGVDAERFDDVPDLNVRDRHPLGDRPLILSVSRLVPRKGNDTLIRAMGFIRRRHPAASLIVVGRGPDRRRLERMAARRSPGAVVFTGEVGDADLPAYYAAADVFAGPCRSRYVGLETEGFGIVFLEAAASAKAAVSGRSGGTPEAVVDGVTGRVVDGRLPMAVGDAVAGLLDSPGLAAAMGRKGRERVERDFAWPRLAARLAGFLGAAVGSHSEPDEEDPSRLPRARVIGSAPTDVDQSHPSSETGVGLAASH